MMMSPAAGASGALGPQRYLVWGGGGHGRVVADLLRALQREVAGYADSDGAKLGRGVDPGGARVLLSEEDLLATIRESGRYPVGIEAIALAVGANERRLECLRALAGLPAPALAHPSASVSPSATLGRATVVFPCSVVNAAARIGQAVIVNSGAVVEHDVVLADGVHVSPGAVLGGGVVVGERSWIGAGATIIPGIRVGPGATVGAGAVVIRHVEDGATVVGNPARILERP